MNNDKIPPFITRQHIFAVAFFAFFLFLLYLSVNLLAPFFSALLGAAVLALALHPVHERVRALTKNREWLAASLMTLITMLLVIGPALAVLAVCASQAADLYHTVSDGLLSGRFPELWNSAFASLAEKLKGHPLLSEIDVKGMVMKGIGELSSGLAGQIGPFLKNSVLLTIDLAVLLVALFFFFRDGGSYYRAIMDMLPFPKEHKETLSQKVRNTFSAVVNGVFLIALMQGVMTGIGFAVCRVPFSVFWGVLAAVLALLPVGGAALIWMPGVLYLFLTGAKARALALAIWGIALVSLPDNFLKPLLIGRKAKLPSFFLFIAILGGLQVYGIFGVLFGPIVVTLLFAFVQIYREEYGER